MIEFKIIPSRSKVEVVWRPVLWICAAMLFALMIFSLFAEDAKVTSVRYPLARLAILLVVTGVVFGTLAAISAGIAEAHRKTRFLLTDKSIILRRPRWSDIEIKLSEIMSITKLNSGDLLVKSSNQTIIIPVQVERFPALSAELAQHTTITVRQTG